MPASWPSAPVAALALAVLSALAGGASAVAADRGLPEQFQYAVGDAQSPAGSLAAPTGIAVAADGTLYVFDADDLRMQHLDRGGHPLHVWGQGGVGEGRFLPTEGVEPAVAPDGSVYLNDRKADRIQHFSASGQYLGSWVVTGDSDWWPMGVPGPYVSRAYDVAVAPDGSVLVANQVTSSIDRFSPDGALLSSWIGGDDPESHWNVALKQIAVGPDGTLFIIICSERVIRVTLEGQPLGDVIGHALGPGLYANYRAIAPAPDGTLYVLADHSAVGGASSRQVMHLSQTGEILHSWAAPAAAGAGGSLVDAAGLAVDPDGVVLVTDPGAGRIARYDATGLPMGDVPTATTEPSGRVHGVRDVAVAGERLYVLDSAGAPAVLAYDLAGRLQRTWGTAGGESGQLRSPVALTVDHDGTVLIVDATGRVQRFTPDGAFLAAHDLSAGCRTGQGDCIVPQALAVAPDGSVFVLHRNGFVDSIIHYDRNWRQLERFGDSEAHGSFNELGAATGLAVSDDGSVYVADCSRHEIVRFTPDGTILGRWGSAGTGRGEFRCPNGLALDGEGRVYVADTDNSRVQIFDPDGVWLGQARPTDRRYADSLSPHRLAVATDGRLFVAPSWGYGVAVLASGAPRAWRLSYFGDRWLGGASRTITNVGDVALEWSALPLPAGVPSSGFSVRFERDLTLAPGFYRFDASGPGGLRLWIGRRLVVDAWDGATTSASPNVAWFESTARVQLEFNGRDPAPGNAVRLTWTRMDDLPQVFLPYVARAIAK